MTLRLNRERRLLDYFLDREGKPVSTFTLERISGRRSWRTVVEKAKLTMKNHAKVSRSRGILVGPKQRGNAVAALTTSPALQERG